jgi:phosphonate transport system substrate-binding protein
MSHINIDYTIQPNQPSPHWAAALAALGLLLSPWPARALETNQASAPEIFTVGMAKVCFLNVNRNDATAAYKVFLEKAARRFGNSYTVAAELYDDSPSFEAAIQREPMNVAVIDPWQFLTMDIHSQMKPCFTVVENGKVGRKYLVLTRRDSGLTNLMSLRGKDILELDFVSAGVGRIWFDTLLLATKLGAPETFFGSTEVVSKPAAAILPVFFGKKSACVVDESSFDLMKELNPQVGQMLQVMAVSDNYADVVLCLRKDRWSSAKLKADTITALKELNQDLAGQQVCTLFKIDRMVPLEESQLDTLRTLQATYTALQNAGAATNAPAPPLSQLGKNDLPPPGRPSL